MKTGLILEGGAMRGMFTAGVLDVLMEQGITVDGMVGVSAGAVFGCNYKSHQIGRTIRYNTTYCNDKRYASFRNLLRTGNLYSEDFCYHEVPEKLDPFDDKAFRESPMDYFVVCTDVRTGDPIYHKCRKGDAEDVLILALGLVAFVFDTIGGVLFAKLLNLFLPEGKKLNPMIGAAGISAFPMSGRVVNKMGLEEDNQNFLLMYSISVNVSGQIASVIAGGLLLTLLGA